MNRSSVKLRLSAAMVAALTAALLSGCTTTAPDNPAASTGAESVDGYITPITLTDPEHLTSPSGLTYGLNDEAPMYVQGKYVLKEQDAAPDFCLEVVDGNGFTGETITLADLNGQIVVLDFWAPWCTYCVEDMPVWQRLTEEFADQPVRIIAIDLGGDTFKEMTQFIQKHGYTFTFAVANADITAAYPCAGPPYDLVIDGDGCIRFIAEGSYLKYAYAVYSDVLTNLVAEIAE